MTLFVGLDLGGTHMRAVAAEPVEGQRPRILGDASRATPRSGPTDVIAALADTIRSAVDKAERALHDVVAVGCSAPGPLDPRTGKVHVAPNIPGFTDVALSERLSTALEGIPVFLDRDTVIAAIGEGLAGAARGARDFVYVTVSTGVGGAIVSGGRMVRGATNTAGEIGHWPIALMGPRGSGATAGIEGLPPCGCGAVGCVESFAGGRNLATRFGVAEASEVFRAADTGDARAKELVAQAEAALASLAVGLVNGLNPALIVVGGGISEHEPEHVLEPMRKAIRERAFKVPAAAARVVPAELGADVGMIGAVLAARERASGRGEWSQ
ncbi:MAG: ROK family protein [Chloroflexi bacterium]|nr:ROK family protein [Chloroflexota bacterium]